MDWLISAGDALSQLLGRMIPVRIDRRWQCWTASANESVSGAAFRHRIEDGIRWPERWIDRLLGRGHCAAAFWADYRRAIEYADKAEAIGQ